MQGEDREEALLRSVALQNSQSILAARQRAERELLQAKEALRQQSEWLRITLASIGDAVISTDAEGRVTFLNGVAESLTGWSQGEAVGRPLPEVFHIVNEQTRMAVENPALRTLREGTIMGLANHTVLIARDGSERPIDDSAAPMRAESGETVGAVLVFRDVTERKRAELEQAERGRLVALRADVAVALASGDGLEDVLQRSAEAIVRHLDAAFARVWTLDEAAGMLDLRASAGLDTHLKGPHGRIRVGEHKVGRIAQERRPHLTNALPDDPNVSDSEWARRERMIAFAGYPLAVAGRLVGVLALFARHALSETVLADLAPLADAVAQCIERKRGEEALRQSEGRYRQAAAEAARAAEANAKFRAFFEQGTNFAGVLALDGTVVEANRLCLDACGFTREEVIGKPFWKCGWWNGSAALEDMVRAACRQATEGQMFRVETSYFVASGAERVVDLVLAPVMDDASRVLFVAATGTDITERRQMEDSLRELDRKKDEFIALLAHELRNPLAPIRNGLQVIRLADGNAEAIALARDMMDRQLGHMVRLIDDLLDVSRIGQNKMELRRERVLLSDVVSSAVETARPLIDDRGHELIISLPQRPIYLDADLTRLAQVFSNLLSNSARYTPPGGRIWLSAERSEGEVAVSVRDTGIGIPGRSLSTIFDMFSQVDRSIERSTGGLGIGLALVKGLTEMHGGTVTAMSGGQGKGSTFTVKLPVLASRPEPAGVTPIHDGLAGSGPRRRILVVDDNRDGADSLAMMLRLMGNEVRTANDGLEAVETAEQFRPEVVLMDVGMPRLNGLDATRRIRGQPWSKGVRVVALTGWGQEGDRERSREAGCDGHLVKPVNLDDLQKLLGELPGPGRP